MLQIVTSHDQLKCALDIIADNFGQCLYLYCNICKYGFANDHFKIYIDQENSCVVGVYFEESIHVFCQEQIPEVLTNFVIDHRPKTVFSSVPIQLGNKYVCEIEGVYSNEGGLFFDASSNGIESVGWEELPDLVDFLLQHSESYRKGYSKEALLLQLQERLSDNYSRYFVIRNQRKIIGCAFTKAELNNLVIVGGILVDAHERGRGIGLALCRYKAVIASSENKRSYCFISSTNKASICMHEKTGYIKKCDVFKYVMR